MGHDDIRRLNKICDLRKMMILKSLHKGPRSFSELKNECMLTDGNLFRHLTPMLNAEFISKEKRGLGRKAKSVYTLTYEGQREFDKLLDILLSILKN